MLRTKEVTFQTKEIKQARHIDAKSLLNGVNKQIPLNSSSSLLHLEFKLKKKLVLCSMIVNKYHDTKNKNTFCMRTVKNK